MRRSLLLRLLGLSLAVAAVAVGATAWPAAYSTGTQLRDELERETSLLETDSEIRSALLRHARQHRGWDGVEPLVRELAERTGRRIALTTPDGAPIVDSAQGAEELPATRAAEIDATEHGTVLALATESATERASGVHDLVYEGWQLTEQAPSRRERSSRRSGNTTSTRGAEDSYGAVPASMGREHEAFVHGRDVERLVRQRLVPVRDRREVVGALVGVAVLDGHPDRGLKRDRVLDVEAVQGDFAGPVVPAGECDAVVGRVVGL